MYIDKPFSSIIVVIFGDPGQLPPVKSNSLWIDICKDDDLYRFRLYQQFIDVVILEENNRLDQNDPDTVLFEKFLSKLHNDENNNDVFELLCMKYSYYTIEHNEWIEKKFKDDDTISI